MARARDATREAPDSQQANPQARQAQATHEAEEEAPDLQQVNPRAQLAQAVRDAEREAEGARQIARRVDERAEQAMDAQETRHAARMRDRQIFRNEVITENLARARATEREDTRQQRVSEMARRINEQEERVRLEAAAREFEKRYPGMYSPGLVRYILDHPFGLPADANQTLEAIRRGNFDRETLRKMRLVLEIVKANLRNAPRTYLGHRV